MKTKKSRDPWGQLTVVDLYSCEKKLLTTPAVIKKFPTELCKLIKMKLYGKPVFKRLGKGRLEGYSLMQFIETSTIILHMDEFDNRAFIDIFSCKKFNGKTAVAFAKKYFKAKKAIHKTIYRG